MNFLKKLFNILNMYDSPSCDVKGNAFLYGICAYAPPLAKHIIFAPMPDGIKQNLINSYKQTIPPELLKLYEAMNGANLFWTARLVGKNNTRIPYCYLSIYGVPLTWNREHIEPFNISIEDLNRPKGTPNTWLKFGSYYGCEIPTNRLDLFVDTSTNAVFAVEHSYAECCVSKTWDTIDDCLCYLFDLFYYSDMHKTYHSTP